MGLFPPFFSCMETSRTEPVKQMQMLCCFLSFYSGPRAWNWSSLTLPSKRRKGTLWYFKNYAEKKRALAWISGVDPLVWLPFQNGLRGAENMLGMGKDAEKHEAAISLGGSGGSKNSRLRGFTLMRKKHFTFAQELCDRSAREVRGCRSGMEMSLGITPPWRGHLMSPGWAETHREPPWNAPKGMVFAFPELKGTVLWWGAEVWKQKGG